MERLKSFYWSLALVVVLWGSTFLIFIKSDWENEDRGVFGDMFGAVNALFSGLAFAGIIYTIQMQRKELALQRDELVLQRAEISKSTQELAGQKDLMATQQFDSTFFNLINLHNKVVENTSYSSFKGKETFIAFYATYCKDQVETTVRQRFRESYEASGDTFVNFTSSVFTIIDFVNNSHLSKERKEQYIKFFKAQFSHYELIFLQSFCYFGNRQDLMMKLSYYKFTENVNDGLLSQAYYEDSQ